MSARRALLLLAVLAVLAAAIYYAFLRPDPSPQQPDVQQEQAFSVAVLRVIDGDTIVVDGDVHVRTLGDNTPETTKGKHECYGAEATAKVTDLTMDSRVILTSDPSQDQTDRYGRSLRYVTLDDGQDLGLFLISNGYAREATYDGKYQKQDQYRAAEAAARDQGRGGWSVCAW